MTADLDELIAQAHIDIDSALATCSNPVLAFSGGKDSIVMAHLMALHGITIGACEVSHYYERQAADVQNIAANMGLTISWEKRRDDDWLRRNPQYLFAADSRIRLKWFAQRQHTTMRDYATENGHDMVVFGRRTQENTVPHMLYKTRHLGSFHPIRAWKHEHIWAYMDKVGIPKPWIYHNVHGQLVGNGPFFNLKHKLVGGYEQAWRLANSLDPSITPERFTTTRSITE